MLDTLSPRSGPLARLETLLVRYRARAEAARDRLADSEVAALAGELSELLRELPPEALVQSLDRVADDDLAWELADLLERPGIRDGVGSAPGVGLGAHPGGGSLDRLAELLAARGPEGVRADPSRDGLRASGPREGLGERRIGLPMAAAVVLASAAAWNWTGTPLPSLGDSRAERLLVRLPGDGSWLGEIVAGAPEGTAGGTGGAADDPRAWYRRGVAEARRGRHAEAAEWYRKAGEAGYAPAQNDLGVLYANGQGVERSFGHAVAWVRRGAEQGLVAAQLNLACYLAEGPEGIRDRSEAAAWYLRAAEAGSPLAQNNLSALYAEGSGVAKDLAASVRWLRRAAEAGEPTAEYNLGLAYEQGAGVEADPGAALAWYRRSAEHGLAAGQYKVGLWLEQGLAGRSDREAGASWLRKAAAQGHELAQERLALGGG